MILTKGRLIHHAEHDIWKDRPLSLNFEIHLKGVLDEVPREYPEHGLGQDAIIAFWLLAPTNLV